MALSKPCITCTVHNLTSLCQHDSKIYTKSLKNWIHSSNNRAWLACAQGDIYQQSLDVNPLPVHRMLECLTGGGASFKHWTLWATIQLSSGIDLLWRPEQGTETDAF